MKKFIFIIAVFITTNSTAQVSQKRAAPKEVAPVTVKNVKYTAPATEMGFIVARDVKTDSVLWKKQVYKITYDKNLETDVQDDFIASIYKHSNYLIIRTEKKKTYRLRLAK